MARPLATELAAEPCGKQAIPPETSYPNWPNHRVYPRGARADQRTGLERFFMGMLRLSKAVPS
jgi:hypothetical protein